MGPESHASGLKAPRVPGTPGLLPALAVAWAFVIARNLIFVVFEESFFDSDQAIVGLMAKHLSEGRAFPLFFYGQNYMIGVDAYVAAPVFWLFGPTVGALHAALVLVNLAATTLLLVGLVRCGVSPWFALLSSAIVTMAPPLATKSLLEPAAIAQFLYVLLLWGLRRRPLWWGVVFAVGFLHREFTLYALPALFMVELAQAGWWPARVVVRRWAVAAVSTVACWQAILALAPYADLMGPGTRGQLLRGFAVSQGGNLVDRISLAPAEWPVRMWVMVSESLPRLYGARHVQEAVAAQGRDWLLVPLGLALGVALARGAWLGLRPGNRGRATFAWYLAGVGATAIFAYVATRPVGDVSDRYFILGLLLPVGAFGAFFALEPSRWWRFTVAAVVVLWSAMSCVDHARELVRYARSTEPDDIRLLADGLVERNIRVAEAPYWRAYKLTFLTQERVIVASTELVRVQSYRAAADEAGAGLVRISEQPCAGGERLLLWYLCRDTR